MKACKLIKTVRLKQRLVYDNDSTTVKDGVMIRVGREHVGEAGGDNRKNLNREE